jgi:chromosome segregation ATPase
MSITLVKLTDEILRVQNQLLELHDELEASGGELDADLETRLDAITATMDRLKMPLAEKIDSIVSVIKNNEHIAQGMRDEAQALVSRARSHENVAARLKHYLADCMRRLGERRIETVRSLVSLRQSPPAVRTSGTLDEVPEKWIRIIPQRRELDARAVLADLRAENRLPSEPGRHEMEGVVVLIGEHIHIR